MVAYTLPSDTDQSAILRGQRLGMLQKPRRAGATHQHGGPGSRIHLKIARNRDNPIRDVATLRCILNAEVVFNAEGVQRIVSAEARPGSVEGVHALLTNAEQGSPHDREAAGNKLAFALGYDDYAHLWASVGGGKVPFSVRTLLAWERMA